MPNLTFSDQRDLGALIPAALDDFGLDPYTFRVYCHIARRAGGKHGCYASQPSMADTCGMSARKLRDCIQELEDAGLIEEDQEHPSGDRRRRRYFLLQIPERDAGSPDNRNEMPVEPERDAGNYRNEVPTEGVPSKGDREGVTRTPVMSAPSGADAPQSVDQASQKHEVPREAARLCHELARMIADNDYSLPSPGSDAVERWYTACDRLLRLGEPGDGGHVPDLDEALEVARWATNDEFWRANIRSAEKFRKQFNRLRLDMQRDNGGKANGWTGADYRRAAEQMRASR